MFRGSDVRPPPKQIFRRSNGDDVWQRRERNRLFQFGATTKGELGNGMGLWLVKQLVSRHGGTIQVESTPGEGSRFTLNWPRRIPEGNTNEASMSAAWRSSPQP